jgi:hypothetical protein
VPEDEEARLHEVREARRTHAELVQSNGSIERVAKAAQDMFDVPIVMVNFVDLEEQIHMAIIGDWEEPPDTLDRNAAICPNAVVPEAPDVYIVRDIAKHPNFYHLAQNKPNMRFYAGAVLTQNNQRIGALCMIDRKLRPDLCSKQNVDKMKMMANQLMSVLHGSDLIPVASSPRIPSLRLNSGFAGIRNLLSRFLRQRGDRENDRSSESKYTSRTAKELSSRSSFWRDSHRRYVIEDDIPIDKQALEPEVVIDSAKAGASDLATDDKGDPSADRDGKSVELEEGIDSLKIGQSTSTEGSFPRRPSDLAEQSGSSELDSPISEVVAEKKVMAKGAQGGKQEKEGKTQEQTDKALWRMYDSWYAKPKASDGPTSHPPATAPPLPSMASRGRGSKRRGTAQNRMSMLEIVQETNAEDSLSTIREV